MPRELLPELISEILLSLPVKSLLRFRCLSNPLCNEIDSPNFVQIHLKRSIETKSHRKLIFRDNEDFNAAIDGLRITLIFRNPVQYILCNACHGLFLLCVKGNFGPDLLLLWNPATRRLKMLRYGEYPRDFFPCYGVEYDSATDDYNVVVDLYINEDYFASPTNRNQIPPHSDEVREVLAYRFCVFSLKSNSWRHMQDQHLHRKIIKPNSFDSCDGWESLVSLDNGGIFQVAQASTQTSTSMQTHTLLLQSQLEAVAGKG